ncbi:uncharacterized protein M6B38_271005 [Iris pallida]|uniref:Uncharacterized protein n=1 Tax=Iris pallida TaxID=29817 RepID=A0AAX6I7D2_IRIPA|nr:uncharacterized protein M6B38_317115 [Iris pallida]KAJ6849176.1 uncharacterized protein M6B38_271005 [Iris pallida]
MEMLLLIGECMFRGHLKRRTHRSKDCRWIVLKYWFKFSFVSFLSSSPTPLPFV